MAGLPYHIYSDASDVAIGASLQQVQPITLRDLKGSKIYDRVIAAFTAKEPVPQVAHWASKWMNDVPTPGAWESNVDDMIVHVKHVITYWSRSLKKAKHNYSATE